MRKYSLPYYFISISAWSAILMMVIGIIASFFNGNPSQNGLYYLSKKIDSNFYIQMLDKEIPGKAYTQTDLFSSLINFMNPFAILKNEIPGLPDLSKDMSPVVTKEFNTAEMISPSSFIRSSLPDQPPNRKGIEASSMAPAVFIYHTHNRESWINGAISNNFKDDPSDPTQNITLVGKYFADKLDSIGIPVHFDPTDHTGILEKKNESYSNSYTVSAETVSAAIQNDPQISYIFDIHRDSIDRKKTTATINGTTFAKIMFVIGQYNPHWEQNKTFAERLQKSLEEKYPGITRPIVVYSKGKNKSGEYHNGEYNQSLSPNALTVEIGGVGNTLEETNRTAALLAEAFAEIYFNAVPVFNQDGGSSQ